MFSPVANVSDLVFAWNWSVIQGTCSFYGNKLEPWLDGGVRPCRMTTGLVGPLNILGVLIR
jgi:hypothetical protein